MKLSLPRYECEDCGYIASDQKDCIDHAESTGHNIKWKLPKEKVIK